MTGGLSFSNNISDVSYSQFFPWVNKNNGYNVTQFYTVSIPSKADDFRIMGGTQDNGTPFFIWNNSNEATSDLSSGDGSYSHFTSGKFAYSSIYDGQIYRLNYDNSGIPSFDAGWTEITPLNATGQLFINPFVIDANKENIMYYPAGNSVWKNAAITLISPYLQGGTESGWIELANMKMPEEYSITAINVTSSNPTNLLYYAGYKENEIPKIYKLESANSATTGNVDVSIPTASLGAYIHHIAINPENGNEILVVISNYNVPSLFHSTDGGQNYTEIEGNLAGDETNPGPSIRSAIIHPNNSSTNYFVGTSTGLYSTSTLNGNNTVWEQESSNEIGNVIVEFLDARTSDGIIAVATHGRGLFIGKPNGAVNIEDNVKIENEFVLNQNYPNPFNPTTKINFTITKSQNVKLNVFNSNGELVKSLINKNLINGNYSIEFDGRNFASGIYYYRLESENFNSTKKMILLK
ncbi:MAG: T9SS type A sorting domain-containing protein [Ignavibacteriae bacterium]|nr:T9SS type A sorting domain-containing protein [Ignavibacteriota bacterium]